MEDCKTLVQSTVQTSIKAQIRSRHDLTQNHGKARNDALKSWLSMDKPLSYGTGKADTRGGYHHLLLILNEDPQSPITDLKTSPDRFTYLDLGKLLYAHGAIIGNNQVSAPIIRNGSCRPALRLAFSHIERVASLGEEDKLTIAALIARMLRKMDIHIVPWRKGDRTDSHATVACGDWWMKISQTGSSDVNNQLQRAEENGEGLQVQHVLDRNIDAPWSLPSAMQQMGPLWNKVTLPSQWALEHASLPPTTPGHENHYVTETYEYVRDVYDGRIWWHHMGLVWGIIFSKATPFLCIPKNITLDATESIASLTREVRQIPWIKSTSKGHRGMMNPLPFITMMTTTIVSLLDSSSPLRKRMNQHKNSMGSVWTKKHGMKYHAHMNATAVTDIILGHKEINGPNMVRIGLAKCLKDGLLRTPNYGSNWEMKSLDELRPLYDKVMVLLKSGKHGEYLAVKEVVGEQIAIRAAMNGEMEMPLFVTAEQKKEVSRSSGI